MKWPFIVWSTRDSYHARCNTCGFNFSVAAGGANDIVEIYHFGSLEYWKVYFKVGSSENYLHVNTIIYFFST